MSQRVYQKLKKQNGERFAQAVRNHHNGILEIPNILEILRYAGREAEPLLHYLMALMTEQEIEDEVSSSEDPFRLLGQAGYDAFYADSLKKQNSIQHHFTSKELLCTFNDKSRYQKYHIVHAVKKGVEHIKREDFKGKEERHDAYGTSVISIQMLKTGGFISIKNRYNHTVSGCDNTFGSNPNNIIKGLSGALKTHFNVEFSSKGSELKGDYVEVGNQIVEFHKEMQNIYYGHNVWVKDGEIHPVNRSIGDGMFDRFVFNGETKMMEKIDSKSHDSFAEDFNRYYGGNPDLYVDKKGDLILYDTVLIGTDHSRIISLHLPELETMSDNFMHYADDLKHAYFPRLKEMGFGCFRESPLLEDFSAPLLLTMGDSCMETVQELRTLDVSSLKSTENNCLSNAPKLSLSSIPISTQFGERCVNPYHLLYTIARKVNAVRASLGMT